MGSKKTSTSTQKTNQTTTPVISEPYNSSFTGFTGQINDFMASDPTQYVAPVSPLQQQAFGMAGNLGAGNAHIDAASDYAGRAANAPASSVSFEGYNAPQLGRAAQYGGASLGPASLYGGAELADPRMLHEFMDDYQNPYTGQVIDATMADFDEYAGTQRAQMQADAAKTAAFGGSRYGVAQGQLEGELARGRASTQAALLDQKFRLAAQLAGVDAGAANQFALQQGGWDQQAGLAGMDALNNFASMQAQFKQQAGLSSMDARNQFSLAQAGLSADAARFGAEAANNQSLTNANLLEQEYQRQLQAAGLEAGLGQLAGSQELAQLGAVAGLGEMQRGIESEYTNAVPTQLQMGANLYGSLYPGLYAGTNTQGTSSGTTTEKSSGLGAFVPIIGSGLQALGSAGQGTLNFSDRRLKSDVERIGDYGRIGLYRYRIFGNEETGVMADEVAQHYPEALGPEVGGYATVNYDKLKELQGDH